MLHVNWVYLEKGLETLREAGGGGGGGTLPFREA